MRQRIGRRTENQRRPRGLGVQTEQISSHAFVFSHIALDATGNVCGSIRQLSMYIPGTSMHNIQDFFRTSLVTTSCGTARSTRREQEPYGSSTTGRMRGLPWIATSRPSPWPPLARPAPVCGLGVRRDCDQFNPSAQDRGVTPDDGGSCRLPLCCRGKVSRDQNDAGGQVQILHFQERFCASCNDAGHLVHVLHVVRSVHTSQPDQSLCSTNDSIPRIERMVRECDCRASLIRKSCCASVTCEETSHRAHAQKCKRDKWSAVGHMKKSKGLSFNDIPSKKPNETQPTKEEIKNVDRTST